ncbi:MAG: hydrogenase/urease maturation nickel metallochaperone HypA [bacterium]
MHDSSIFRSLLKKIAAIASAHESARVTGVRVQLGATSHMDEAHFLEHWNEATRGSGLEDVEITVDSSPEPFGVMLVDVDLET